MTDEEQEDPLEKLQRLKRERELRERAAQSNVPAIDNPDDPLAKLMKLKREREGKKEYKAVVPRGTGADVVRSALHGISFGMLDKPIAFVDALTAADKSVPVGERYEKFKEAGRGAQHEFTQAHPVANLGIQLAAGTVPMLLTGGGGAAAELGTLGRAWQAAKTGGAIAGTAGFVNQDGTLKQKVGAGLTEGLGGMALGGILSGAGSAGGAIANRVGATRLLSKITEKLATAVEPEEKAMLERARQWVANQLRDVSGSIGPKGQAVKQINERRVADVEAGFTPKSVSKDVPFLAVDEAGPELTDLAKNVVRTGGGSTLRGAVTEREAQAQPATGKLLTELTGVKPGRGAQQLHQRITQEKAVGDEVFDQARAITQGKAAMSPTLRGIIDTPSGRIAERMTNAQYEALGREMPIVSRVVEKRPKNTDPLMTNKQWNNMLDQALEMGVEIPGLSRETVKEAVPDAEWVHIFKQNLSKMAKLGDRDPSGMASEAYAHSRQFGKVREEMDDAFRWADEMLSGEKAKTEALTTGQDIFGLKEVPKGRTAKARYKKSLETRVAEAREKAPEELQQGAATAAHQLARTAPREDFDPKRLYLKNAERRTQLREAFKSPDDAERFSAAAESWGDVLKRSRHLLSGSHTSDLLFGEQRRGTGAVTLRDVARMGMRKLAGKEREYVNQEIASILSSADRGTMGQVEARARIRNLLMKRLSRGIGGQAAQITDMWGQSGR